MSLRAKFVLTYYYFKNAYPMLWLNSIPVLLSVFLLFTVGNLSHGLSVTLGQKEGREFLLSLNNSVQSGLEDIDIMRFNHYFEGEALLQRLDPKMQVSFRNSVDDVFDLRLSAMNGMDESSLIVSELAADAFDISIGDSLFLGSRVLGVIQIEVFAEDVDVYVSESVYLELSQLYVTEDSTLILKVSDVFNENHGLSFVNQLLNRNISLYSMERVDFSEFVFSLIKLVRNFLFVVGGLVFFVSMFMIRNVVTISAMDRKDEFVILRSFGLSKRAVYHLLIIEILILVLFSICVAFVGSSTFLLLLSYALDLVYRLDFTFIVTVVVVVMVLAYLSALISSRGLNRIEITDLD